MSLCGTRPMTAHDSSLSSHFKYFFISIASRLTRTLHSSPSQSASQPTRCRWRRSLCHISRVLSVMPDAVWHVGLPAHALNARLHTFSSLRSFHVTNYRQLSTVLVTRPGQPRVPTFPRQSRGAVVIYGKWGKNWTLPALDIFFFILIVCAYVRPPGRVN